MVIVLLTLQVGGVAIVEGALLLPSLLPGRCVDPYADNGKVHHDVAAAAASLPTASNNSGCVYPAPAWPTTSVSRQRLRRTAATSITRSSSGLLATTTATTHWEGRR